MVKNMVSGKDLLVSKPMMVMLKKGFTIKQYGFVIALHVKIGGSTIKKHVVLPVLPSNGTNLSSNWVFLHSWAFHGMVVGLKFHGIYHDILIVWENHQNTSGKSSIFKPST